MIGEGGGTMESLPYYRWLWRDWRSNRKVQRMSWQARGLYRELLDEFWSEGFISADMGELAEVCGCSRAVFEEFWPEILPCWEQVQDGFVNRKMEGQRTAKDAERARRAIAGRRGGLACNSRTRADDAEALAKQVQASAEQMQASPDIAEQSRALALAEQEQSRAEDAPLAPHPASQHPAAEVEPHEAEATETKGTQTGKAKAGKASGVDLPAFVPAKEWAEWLKVKRGAKTPYAQTLAITKLEEFHAAGYDIAAVLNYSIEGAHPSVYVNDKTPKRKVVFEEVDPATFWEGSGLNVNV